MSDAEARRRSAASKPPSASTYSAQATVSRSMLLAVSSPPAMSSTKHCAGTVHPTFPWKVFGGLGWGSPQIYTLDDRRMRRGLTEWAGAGWEHVVPSVAAFGVRSGSAMRKRLEAYRDYPGVIVWSFRQLDAAEWRVLGEFTERLAA